MANGTSREDECFGTRIVFKTLDDKRASVIEACMKDEAGMMAHVWHDGTTGEGVEEATLSTYGETTVKGKVEDSRAGNTALRVDMRFGTHVVSETSSDEGASMNKACMIEEDNGCEANKVHEVVVNDKVKEVTMNKTTRMNNDHDKTFSTLVLETWAVEFGNRLKTKDTEGGNGEPKVEANADKNVEAKVDMDELIGMSVTRLSPHWFQRLGQLRLPTNIRPIR